MTISECHLCAINTFVLVLCFYYSHMCIVNDMYHIRTYLRLQHYVLSLQC